jgi:hypothetical protein
LAIHCAQKNINLESDDLENEILTEKCQPTTLREVPAHPSWLVEERSRQRSAFVGMEVLSREREQRRREAPHRGEDAPISGRPILSCVLVSKSEAS